MSILTSPIPYKPQRIRAIARILSFLPSSGLSHLCDVSHWGTVPHTSTGATCPAYV